MYEEVKTRRTELNPDRIIEQEQALFDEWSNRVDGILRDGVVDAELYCKSSPRILVVLKEMNDYQDPRGLTGHLQDGGRDRRTWNATSRWIYGIRHLQSDLPWSEIVSEPHKKEFRKKYLSDIAAINVKKTTGGHTADASAIDSFVQNPTNQEYLKEQVKLYQPEIVICGGTARWYREFMDKESIPSQLSKKGVEYFVEPTGAKVICFNHPDARVPENLLYYMLIDALRELMN